MIGSEYTLMWGARTKQFPAHCLAVAWALQHLGQTHWVVEPESHCT